jgi:carbon-monoxide dehydrogenase large subunit
VINAVVDALSHLGVTDVGKPASPERVWRAIRDAQAEGPPGVRSSGTAGAAPGNQGGGA